MKRSTLIIYSALLILAAVYFAGPKPERIQVNPEVDPIAVDFTELEQWIAAKEKRAKGIKPDNESQIIWADSIGKKTRYAVVYLHGFSASQGDGNPAHRDFAKRYGCNLYLPRLAPHGIAEENTLLTLTAKGLINEAREAVAIGSHLGDSVILMTCSTGSTLGLYLAAHNQFHSVICYSPNIDIYDPLSHLLNNPWGLQLARLSQGGKFRSWDLPDEAKKYWNGTYRVEALVELRQLVDFTMTPENFKKIEEPVLVIGYYEDEDRQDKTVSIQAMQKMMDELGTDPELKHLHLVGSVGSHMLASDIFSEDIDLVKRLSFKFAEEVLGLSPLLW